MLPVSLNLSFLSVLLIGNGEKAVRRLELLDEAGATKLKVYSPNPSAELCQAAGERLVETLEWDGLNVLMVADLPEAEAAELALEARRRGVLVNVEDVMPFCDFHFVSVVRRGDLLLTVSTGGGSPAMASAVRKRLERLFPAVWGERLKEMAEKRKEWQGQGLTTMEIKEKSEKIIEQYSDTNEVVIPAEAGTQSAKK